MSFNACIFVLLLALIFKCIKCTLLCTVCTFHFFWILSLDKPMEKREWQSTNLAYVEDLWWVSDFPIYLQKGTSFLPFTSKQAILPSFLWRKFVAFLLHTFWLHSMVKVKLYTFCALHLSSHKEALENIFILLPISGREKIENNLWFRRWTSTRTEYLTVHTTPSWEILFLVPL